MTRAKVVYLDARAGRGRSRRSAPPAGGFYLALRRDADEVRALPTLRLVPPEARPARVSMRAGSPRARFDELVARWKSETQFESSSTKLFLHPAYQQIIGMGPEALPLLLGSLEEGPEHWSWALKAITGEDPVPESARGNLRQTADAWLTWARRAGLR